MIDTLLKLVPWYWRWAAFIALIISAMAFGAVKMHQHDELVLDKLEVDIARVQAIAAQRQFDKELQSKQLIEEKDKDRENELQANDAVWSQYADELQRTITRRNTMPKPIPKPPTVCDNTAGNSKLLAAIT